MNNPTLNSEHFERAAHSLSRSMDNFGTGDFNESVRRFEQAADTLRCQIDRLARIAGMQAENDQRKALGHSMAYTESDFISV